MKPRRLASARAVGQASNDLCACDKCVALCPARAALRKKRGWGLYGRRKYTPDGKAVGK